MQVKRQETILITILFYNISSRRQIYKNNFILVFLHSTLYFSLYFSSLYFCEFIPLATIHD